MEHIYIEIEIDRSEDRFDVDDMLEHGMSFEDISEYREINREEDDIREGDYVKENCLSTKDVENYLLRKEAREIFARVDSLIESDLNRDDSIMIDIPNFDFSNPNFICKGEQTAIEQMAEVVVEIDLMSVEDLCDSVKYFTAKEKRINQKYCTEFDFITQALIENMGIFYILNK